MYLAATLTMRAAWVQTPQADGLPTPTASCSGNELCQKRLRWPVQASLLGLAVPLLLPHLASQSGIAQEASRGMNPGVSGTLTLLQKAWSCGGGSYLLSGWGAGGQAESCQSWEWGGGGWGGPSWTQEAKVCRT